MVSRVQVFAVMETAKATMSILDWGVANATLEEVKTLARFVHHAQSRQQDLFSCALDRTTWISACPLLPSADCCT